MPESNTRRKYLKNIERLVIKLGSNVLTAEKNLNIQVIRQIAMQVHQFIQKGISVTIVSSGAMAAGMRKLSLDARPTEIPLRQAIAAIGQAGLIQEYEKAFDFFDHKVAQILLTRKDLSNRIRYLNARNTMRALFNWNVIPIVNENDTVAVEEIKFGDNDHLSAMIALLVNADLLINLTDIDGLFDKDPRIHQDAQFIPMVTSFTKDLESFASGIPGALGTGGMLSKIRAAQKVTTAGIPMIIAKASENVLINILEGDNIGTFFVPKNHKMKNRKSWIAFSKKTRGHIQIDDGAYHAILNKGTSLLPIGVTSVSGKFSIGDAIAIETQSATKIGIGLTNYSSDDIQLIMQKKSNAIESILGEKPYDEIIHRDNMVITLNN
ncbi:MAG: Glutamate 5-kinase [Candidatus Magnetoglobus multicellularis str. Araruama]|uniref:Glutamate 5-kinase n=1 Tax=Candidatus Magnetoglobus multicellularis str. Araruama TaxID=890399 RepID=A0A1V1PAV6_9BACT|nr:MAG: Glutamate 5-kinase [Candidatus Magnetoglobus multicellularis str. Araruama]